MVGMVGISENFSNLPKIMKILQKLTFMSRVQHDK